MWISVVAALAALSAPAAESGSLTLSNVRATYGVLGPARAGDRVQIVAGLFTGRFGLCASVSREHIAVLLFMLGAQRLVRLNHDAVELATEDSAS